MKNQEEFKQIEDDEVINITANALDMVQKPHTQQQHTSTPSDVTTLNHNMKTSKIIGINNKNINENNNKNKNINVIDIIEELNDIEMTRIDEQRGKGVKRNLSPNSLIDNEHHKKLRQKDQLK